jgi:hypothetical protein
VSDHIDIKERIAPYVGGSAMTDQKVQEAADALDTMYFGMSDYDRELYKPQYLTLLSAIKERDERIERLTACPAGFKTELQCATCSWPDDPRCLRNRYAAEVEQLRKVAEAVLDLKHEWNPEGLTDHDGNWFYADSEDAHTICEFIRASLPHKEGEQ